MNAQNGTPPGGRGARFARPTVRRTYCVFNKKEQSFLGLSIGRCDTTVTRLRGLLGKVGLKSGEGLWFVPSQGVHTVGVLFPVDVVFLDAQNKVIHLIEHLRPLRISGLKLKCMSVLQLPTHTIYSSQTHVGDDLLICEPHEMDAYLKTSPLKGTPSELPKRVSA